MGNKVCAYVCVRMMGMETRSKRAVGNRTLSVMVPEARVSEVHEIVSRALAGLIESPIDNEERRA
jgi:hypothetical protein